MIGVLRSRVIRIFGVVLVGLLVLPRPGLARDGVVLISQACADSATGCFAGDAAGLPVEITVAGSYRLTSNLSLGGAPQGILVSADDVTVDLGGFVIQGPGTCGGTPVTCSGTASTSGVSAGNGDRVVVRNGTIRGVAFGVNVGAGGVLEGLRVVEVSDIGLLGQLEAARIVDNVVSTAEAIAISAGPGSLVARNTVRDCGTFGLFLQADTGYGQNEISGCGTSVNGGRAIAGNVCDDGGCRRVPMRDYYVSPAAVTGGAAPTACDPGFHMASLYEILDPSQLAYDASRGGVEVDAGSGPPSGPPARGWIRTGVNAGGLAFPPIVGLSNCGAYASSSGTAYGAAVYLVDDWETPNAGHEDPFEPSAPVCSTPLRVWCLED